MTTNERVETNDVLARVAAEICKEEQEYEDWLLAKVAEDEEAAAAVWDGVKVEWTGAGFNLV